MNPDYKIDRHFKFKNVVLERFVLIILVLRITSDTKMLEKFILLTLVMKIRQLNSSMLNQNVNMFVK